MSEKRRFKALIVLLFIGQMPRNKGFMDIQEIIYAQRDQL